MRDALHRLRALALEGIAEESAALGSPPARPARRPRRDDGLAPAIPPDAPVYPREPLGGLLRDEAARVWRRHASAWSPSLPALCAAGVLGVQVRRDGVDVLMANGTHRARHLPRPWVPVIAAALLDEELPAVRRRLRVGETELRRR